MGLFQVVLGLFGPFFGHVEPILACFRSFWGLLGHFSVIWGLFGPVSGRFGGCLGHFSVIWGLFGPISGRFGSFGTYSTCLDNLELKPSFAEFNLGFN